MIFRIITAVYFFLPQRADLRLDGIMYNKSCTHTINQHLSTFGYDA